ncbi:hypothetical protein, partial [Nocardia farcinica]|uniref:hypothetical protein n=1 Tax=Nocardia farcinica TaxID=37329 RepID=UPI0024576022
TAKLVCLSEATAEATSRSRVARSPAPTGGAGGWINPPRPPPGVHLWSGARCAADPEQAFRTLLAGCRHELTAFEDACPDAGTAVRELGQPRGWLRHCARRGETLVCFHR